MLTREKSKILSKQSAVIEEYWKSGYCFDTNGNKKNNYYMIEEPNATVYLLGDIEGDYTMIYNWFIQNNIINHDLEWIADKNVYVLQAGDQVDRFNSPNLTEVKNPKVSDQDNYLNVKYIKQNLFDQTYRRTRNHFIDDEYTDLDVLVFFDLLEYISIKRHKRQKVFSVVGNHEILNLQLDLRFAIYYPNNQKLFGNNTIFEKVYKNRERIISKPESPIRSIILKRPVIVKFNNFVLCHAGISNTAIKNYLTETGSRFFNLEDYIEKVNTYMPNKYVATRYFYKFVIEPLVWSRDYFPVDKSKNTSYIEEVAVLGHNNFENVYFCDPKSCAPIDYWNKDDVNKIVMIKVDSGDSSRQCVKNLSKIYTAEIYFKNSTMVDFKKNYYGFKCLSVDYKRPDLQLRPKLEKLL